MRGILKKCSGIFLLKNEGNKISMKGDSIRHSPLQERLSLGIQHFTFQGIFAFQHLQASLKC